MKATLNTESVKLDGRTFVGAGSLCKLTTNKLTTNRFNGELPDSIKPALTASFDTMPIGYAIRAGFKFIANDNIMVLFHQPVNEPAPTVVNKQ